MIFQHVNFRSIIFAQTNIFESFLRGKEVRANKVIRHLIILHGDYNPAACCGTNILLALQISRK